MNFLKKIFNSKEKEIRKLMLLVSKINGLEKDFEKLSESELKNKTLRLKERLVNGENDFDILPEAFALVRESAKRSLNQRHFDVQLLAGIVLHSGKIAEMKTGEGKTLASTLSGYLNGLFGKGVHIITVNDYLAKRDAVWMGQIYYGLGLSVGCLVHDDAFIYDADYKQIEKEQDEKRDVKRDKEGGFNVEESYLRPCSRKEAYAADITYGTNNEFGFDYLRDNLVMDKRQKVQRGFFYVIIDEIDSCLIDEARTPLIISAPDFESPKYYQDFAKIAPSLKQETDYTLDEKTKTASLTEDGINKIEKILGLDNIYEEKGAKYLHYLEQSLRAKEFFKKDRDYIIKDGKVIIIDEFTGRLMPGRRWSLGLHQAIEAKEGLKVEQESKTLATITFQNYFRFYKKLSGMTGTAITSKEEFESVYNLEVVQIPTNRPLVREDKSDIIYKTEQAKFRVIVETIKEKNKLGQPVLVGTRSVERNEYLSRLLQREGVEHNILNAKNHQREGVIIAQAGKLGAVTVATNMAGRGVDIALGGPLQNEEERKKVLDVGGLAVIGTERHEARRIDDQLRGRAGRQGDPGESQFFVSLEDELMRVFGGDRIKSMMDTLKVPEDQPIQAGIISRSLEKAQARVEGFHFDSRKHILEYDNVIAKQRNKIYSLRDEILEKDFSGLSDFVLGIVKKEIGFVLAEGGDISDEIKIIIPLPENIKMEEAELFIFVEKIFKQKEIDLTKEKWENILRYVCLSPIDFFWQEHLTTMEHLKEAVGLRAYGGKNPLVEYKTEGLRIFQKMQSRIESQIARTIFKISA